MGAVIEFAIALVSITCGECGVEFAIPKHLQATRLVDKKTFYCPNGHPRAYVKSRVDELEAQLEAQKRDTEWQKQRVARLDKELVAQRGQTTKARNQLARVGNGVCPCCNRTFQNLMRHMATKHPGFKKAGEP